MKKCPTCGKTYDDSWSICLDCHTSLVSDLNIKPTNPGLAKPKKISRGQVAVGAFGGAILALIVSPIYKIVVFSVAQPPLPEEVAGNVGTVGGILAFGSFLLGYYLTIKIFFGRKDKKKW